MGRLNSVILAFLASAVAACGTVSAPPAAEPHRREIALSFDDAPRSGSSIMSGAERGRRLLAGLAAAGTGPVVFFANTGEGRLDGEGGARLQAYADAGHLIANHSATHPHLNGMEPAAYLADVAEADRALRRYATFRPWFRFPFLDEGDTPAKRDAVREGLIAMGYGQGYVTIDTYDWYLDKLARDAATRGDAMDMDALGALYVEMIVGSADFYDDLAVRVLGRSPRHIVLLHEIDLAALYVDELAAALRADGWTIVSPDRAYGDPIATQAPDTLILNQGRVAALGAVAGLAARDLQGPLEEESEIDSLFASRVLIQRTAH
jgi:peptidoglycan-N-acetylglucosamine deacetylase